FESCLVWILYCILDNRAKPGHPRLTTCLRLLDCCLLLGRAETAKPASPADAEAAAADLIESAQCRDADQFGCAQRCFSESRLGHATCGGGRTRCHGLSMERGAPSVETGGQNVGAGSNLGRGARSRLGPQAA